MQINFRNIAGHALSLRAKCFFSFPVKKEPLLAPAAVSDLERMTHFAYLVLHLLATCSPAEKEEKAINVVQEKQQGKVVVAERKSKICSKASKPNAIKIHHKSHKVNLKPNQTLLLSQTFFPQCGLPGQYSQSSQCQMVLVIPFILPPGLVVVWSVFVFCTVGSSRGWKKREFLGPWLLPHSILFHWVKSSWIVPRFIYGP